jgi:hypothetical protein
LSVVSVRGFESPTLRQCVLTSIAQFVEFLYAFVCLDLHAFSAQTATIRRLSEREPMLTYGGRLVPSLRSGRSMANGSIPLLSTFKLPRARSTFAHQPLTL